MRRPTVISLCVFNGALACGLLWYALAAPGRGARLAGKQSQHSEIDALSDAELWGRAAASVNTREAMHYLSRIEARGFLLDACRLQLSKISEGTPAPFGEWPFLEAVLQTYGANAGAPDELAAVTGIAANEAMPLTLRDCAFRTVIENTPRFADNGEALEAAFELVDACYAESNSLSETSLLAEHFLTQKGIAPTGREPSFRDRLTEVAKDKNQADSKRITALHLLATRGEVDAVGLDGLYGGADVALQTAILKSALQAEDAKSYSWVEGIRPTTPEQEQLIEQILNPVGHADKR